MSSPWVRGRQTLAGFPLEALEALVAGAGEGALRVGTDTVRAGPGVQTLVDVCNMYTTSTINMSTSTIDSAVRQG